MSGPILNGKDFNYFTEVTVADGDFPEQAQAEFTFKGNGSFSLTNEGSGNIEYSFNGNTLHGNLKAGTPTAERIFNHRGVSRIWFRLASGPSSLVRVEAMSDGNIAPGASSGGSGGGGSTTIGTVTQGTAAALSGSWPVKISDGTSAVGITTVGSERALKVDVIQSVSSGGSSGSSFNSSNPSSGSAIGLSDGTNLQLPRVFDVDSGAGSQYVVGVNLRLTSSGGSVEAGTSSNPIRIDPTGFTTQPVSGTVTANLGTIAGIALDSNLTSLRAQLPTTLGQQTSANSLAVVLPSDQIISISGSVSISGTPAVSISGTVTTSVSNTINAAAPVWSRTATGAITAVSSGTIKNASGRVRTIRILYSGTGTNYFQIHDKVTATSFSDSTLVGFGYVISATNNTLILDFEEELVMSTGICWAVSSTQATYTAVSQNAYVFAEYI